MRLKEALYPAIKPYRTGFLRVDADHRIYFEESIWSQTWKRSASSSGSSAGWSAGIVGINVSARLRAEVPAPGN